ncbi:Protein N-acetyltransferase, RimJ/RimL family [Salinihabitans flavidus]|uniref:Protein N-acetyltransferase, RimJ/RimL family n=1 Tax=Salinihabitans flavidus TaxID=569882 RepID=A0A1H8L8N0_9RHOB|nr:GNAT family N-acetyltransferase [Salinihabitans flavidus]SEO01078.1 Protein N-acetyltransferase, RimJ/RimL family [Salinihabitans flavidus]
MTGFPVLETERLILRLPREDDFEAEAKFFASDASRFVGGPKRPDETWRALASLIGHWHIRGYGFWALEEKGTGTYLGRVGLWYPHGWPEPEISWTLMTHATGKGYATEAALAARAHAYDVLGWSTAISLIDPANTASEALARRLGAAFETTYEHPAFGTMYIWRHPGPDTLVNGGMEAYA